MTRKELHKLVRSSPQWLFDGKLQDLDKKLVEVTKCPAEKHEKLFKISKSFKTVYKRKWLASNSTETRFLEQNEKWLNEPVTLPAGPIPGTSKGRPTKDFGELSDRSKRRKTMKLRQDISAEELTYAAQMSHRASRNNDLASVIQEVTKSPTRATKFRKAAAIGSKTTITKKHTPEDALMIFVEANMTLAQYEVIHQANKDVYPCYTYVQRAKQDCYPNKNVSETIAEVMLQDLLDHTSSRLCKYLEPVLEQLQPNTELELIYKWGCDGSTQNEYKQKFEEDGNSDAHIFMSSMVPVRLTYGSKVIWQNPHPSSPRFCRPIRFRYVKEDKDVTNEEINHIENQIKSLQPTVVRENIVIKHLLFPTMIDGKVCNAATNTNSTLRCYICGKTSKEFNNLKTYPENRETFKFGLSILHARIRFFEFLLHLSYKIKAGVNKGRIYGKEDKDKIENAKRSIQKEFRERMGLLVDIPKAGYGNTNDGNTSRRFFSDPEAASSITSIDKDLIIKFKIILEVISSGFKIDLEKFSSYNMGVAHYYINLYGWQPMSPTVHKILVHSASVISHALLPIGQLSEEAAEARNKHFRLYRESFSRKFSRIACNEDVINRLLLTSDPYISSRQSEKKWTKSKSPFSNEAAAFFILEPENVDEE